MWLQLIIVVMYYEIKIYEMMLNQQYRFRYVTEIWFVYCFWWGVIPMFNGYALRHRFKSWWLELCFCIEIWIIDFECCKKSFPVDMLTPSLTYTFITLYFFPSPSMFNTRPLSSENLLPYNYQRNNSADHIGALAIINTVTYGNSIRMPVFIELVYFSESGSLGGTISGDPIGEGKPCYSEYILLVKRETSGKVVGQKKNANFFIKRLEISLQIARHTFGNI